MKTVVSILVTTLFLSGPMAAKAQEIFDAVKDNDVARVKQLLATNGSWISLKDASGNSPLHMAAATGSSPITELLLSKGADIDATNTELNTPLHAAVQNGRDEISNFLIKNGADLNKHNASGYTPLHLAALHNRRAIAEALISKGADIESLSNQQYTPLNLIARSTESDEVAEFLIKKGANINARDAAGRTPLNNAILYSSNRIIDMLLDHKAEIGLEPRFLRMMLSAAAQRGHLRSFQFIVEKGGEDLFKDDSENKILMRLAISGGSLEIVKMLQARNVPLDVSPDIEGSTPLHDAARNPQALAMIGFLIENGADVNARTNDGRSAYNIAEASGNKEAMSLILKHDGSPEPQKFPDLTGPYMGQTPPGNEPKRFAPGIVAPSHCTITVSPDGKEIYWATGTRIMGSRNQNGRWTQPAVVSFSGQGSLSLHDDVPFLTPDNRKLFFTSRRPLGAESENKENIWYVERTPSGWSEPRPVSAAVNAMQLHWQVSVSRSGTLYFGGTAEDGYGLLDIYCSKYANGEYTKPVNLGPVINSSDGEMMPCIAPDESFLIFYKVIRQRPSLYISFRAKKGQWLPPKMIERVSARVGAILSLDGKYLFFDNRWVSANIIEELRPKEERRPKTEATRERIDRKQALPMITLTHGLIYGAAITAYLFIFMITFSPRVWGYKDYSEAVKKKVAPQTRREKTLAAIIGLPWLVFALGFPIYSTFALKARFGAQMSFVTAFLHIIVLFMFATFGDLVLLDWLVISKITPKFVIIPGTVKEDYKDFSHHFRAHAKAIIPVIILAVIMAGLIRML